MNTCVMYSTQVHFQLGYHPRRRGFPSRLWRIRDSMGLRGMHFNLGED
jgi:hypothetical protein